MHSEILAKKQFDLLPVVKLFFKDFGLVGGTAIALHIGHRQSIDFDIFTNKEFENSKIRKTISRFRKIERVIRDEKEQYAVLVNEVTFTFLCYPFNINFSKNFDDWIKMPGLLTLAAMKAYALGRRAKWKDYVDFYFIIKDFYSVETISKKAIEIFGNEFNEKNFRSQLAYFKDIDYSEKVIFMNGYETNDRIIKKELVKFSLR